MSNKNHVHVWEWNKPPEALDCTKCGEYLDCGNIVEHMNTLESENASLRERDALIERLVEAGDAVTSKYVQVWGLSSRVSDIWQAVVAEYHASKKESVE